jgi:hypothetical protein
MAREFKAGIFHLKIPVGLDKLDEDRRKKNTFHGKTIYEKEK